MIMRFRLLRLVQLSRQQSRPLTLPLHISRNLQSSSIQSQSTRQQPYILPTSKPDSYQLAARVKTLSRNKQLDEAISLVKSAPSHAATTIVWNGLLHEILQARRFKLAYQTWTDMKRRGVKPNERSWSTFFGGMAKMGKPQGSNNEEAEEARTATMDRVKTIFSQWIVFAEAKESRIIGPRAGKRLSSPSPIEDEDELSNVPTNAYLHFLSATNQHQVLLSTFHSMPSTGPLAPDSLTYSTVLSSLRHLATPQSFEEAIGILYRMEEELVEVDCKTLSILISFCREVSSKRPDDMKVGLGIIKRFFGLVDIADEHLLVFNESPTLTSQKLAPPRAKMDPGALSNVLALALELHMYNLTVAWFDQVRDYPTRFGETLLEVKHADMVLVALAGKKDSSAAEDLLMWLRKSPYPSLHPTLATYTAAIQCCWRSTDLKRALQFLDLMTGASPLSKSSRLPKYEPDERVISTIVQTAMETKNRGHVHRALELAEEWGFGDKNVPPPPKTKTTTMKRGNEEEGVPQPNRKHASYWTFHLAGTIAKAIYKILSARPDSGSAEILSRERKERLRRWMEACERWREEVNPAYVDKVESMRNRRMKIDSRRRVEEGEEAQGESEKVERLPLRKQLADTSPGRNWDEGARRMERKQSRASQDSEVDQEPRRDRPAEKARAGERRLVRKDSWDRSGSGIRYAFDRRGDERRGGGGRERRRDNGEDDGRRERRASWR